MTPLFSGFAGFADGIYSTLWGDGLSGGASSVNVRLEPDRRWPPVICGLWFRRC